MKRRLHVPIKLFHWEHRPPLVKLPILDRIRRPAIPNFGDEIGPIVVEALLASRGLPAAKESVVDGRLLSVGSVFHFAAPGDHIWGTGINAKKSFDFVDPSEVVIHAVRGPRTAEVLRSLGFAVPEVFGDPGLLITLVPEMAHLLNAEKRRRVTLIPNFNDMSRYRDHPDFLSPLRSPMEVASVIAESEFVIGSSLHAMVFADALGVPARLIQSAHEPAFKYEDYYLGSGREVQASAESPDDAIRLGPSDPPEFDREALLSAFPESLFVR